MSGLGDVMSEAADQIVQTLNNAKRVLITTHVRPDGDALGSTAALWLALRAKGIAAKVLLLSHLPTKYAFAYAEPGVDYFDVEKGWPSDFAMDDYDTLAVVDTGTWSQLPGLKDHVGTFRGRKLVIDHHLTQEDWADVKWVDTKAAAAGEIVEELVEKLGVPLDRAIAKALFLAIVSDTGWFQFSNTSPDTLRRSARLIETGVDTDHLYQLLYQNERAERIALQTRAMQSLELLAGNRVAVMQIRKHDFADTRSAVTDTENVINRPLEIRTVAMSILLVEPPEGGPIRISFRSKGQIDVAAFAQQFGGGGHARASGAKVDGTLANAHAKIVGKATERFA
jgi:nanoRNase/pAp phosphatase (c-di-AMP/oligoRNAs hydrolase)